MSLLKLQPVGASEEVRANTDEGPRPELRWIAIDQLRIDDSFQRDIKRAGFTTIQRIIRDFNWSKFSPVIVAALPVKDGRDCFSIIDGQHRSIAALSRGETEVPCYVVVSRNRAEAADIFHAINGAVTAMSSLQIFKAARAAGLEWAVGVDRVCRDLGVEPLVYPVSRAEQKPRQTVAVSLLRTMVERYGVEHLARVLRLVVAHRAAEQPGFIVYAILKWWDVTLRANPHWVPRLDEIEAVVRTAPPLSPMAMHEVIVRSLAGHNAGDRAVVDPLDPALTKRLAEMTRKCWGEQQMLQALRADYPAITYAEVSGLRRRVRGLLELEKES